METKKDFTAEFEAKMRTAGVGDAPIRAFRHNYQCLLGGDTGMIPEDSIQAVEELPRFDQLESSTKANKELISQAMVIKLNGGLGTGMGLERAKSLLEVKNGLTFLDFIARQLAFLQRQHGLPLRMVLMNSYSTSNDTLEFLCKYPELGSPEQLELMQSQEPKVDAQSLRPISWPANPQLEWCPPGHGDIYPSLLSSGLLDRWLKEGRKYLFVSNSDNLGASLDPRVLSYFAESAKPFLMEVAERTSSDSKGGHLARRGDRLLLRESAQCPKEDQASFQDIRKHRFFNTNNLWIRLEPLKEIITANEGFVPLPLIKNSKTVDPRDSNSPQVFQLETAMGAAIQCFANSGALVVPRTRFAPVKTTNDLFALRSDAFQITEDWRVVLAKREDGKPPTIDLDPKHYKLVDQMDQKLKKGVPSLKQCLLLTVRGPVLFSSDNVFSGKVTVSNSSDQPRSLPPGEYCDQDIQL